MDGTLGLGWAKIEHVFEPATRRSVQVRMGDRLLDYRWENEDQRIRAQTEFTAKCKLAPDAEKLAAIAQLAQQAEVEIPSTPVPHYAPMSGRPVRTRKKMGMSLGPHPVTARALRRTTRESADC